LLDIEQMCLGVKPLLFVLNKIDLVPRDVVVRWLGTLRAIAPTVAIAATSPIAATLVVKEAMETLAPGVPQIAVIGIRGVGKSTICTFNSNLLFEAPGYGFLTQSGEMGLLQGIDFVDPLYDLALETLARVADESVFVALEMPIQKNGEAIVQELAKRWGMKPRVAGQRFVEMLWGGEYRWYAVPDDNEATDLSRFQVEALEWSVPFDLTAVSYIPLASGEPLKIDEKLLELPEKDLEDEEEEEEEDSDDE
jgi:hypothetical protein